MSCNNVIFEHILGHVLDHAHASGWKLAKQGFGSLCAGQVAEKYGTQVQHDLESFGLMTGKQRNTLINAASHDAIQDWEKRMAAHPDHIKLPAEPEGPPKSPNVLVKALANFKSTGLSIQKGQTAWITPTRAKGLKAAGLAEYVKNF